MERAAQSVSPSIDQLMCSSQGVILVETEQETEGQKKDARKSNI